jgi:MoaA/NifB/PqqE/SkfB family radical SAM enzyme
MLSVKKLLGFNDKQYDSLPKELVKEYNQHRPLGPQKQLCYAPFKSIYFGNNGDAGVCCYNRKHILGRYPDQSIHQMWFGEEAEKLRDFMSHNDLSLGCLSCKEHLMAGNFDGSKSHQYDANILNKNKYPSVMEFELSNTCNLECEMCNGEFSSLIRAKREGLPPLPQKYNDAFVDQLEEFIPYLEEVKFYGGEPFLIDIYYTIWERIVKINPKVRIQVQTNATTLNTRLKDLMSKIDFHINVSFDSLRKEVYEKIRKNADFDRVTSNIEYFRNYCNERNTYFGISVCAMQQNWKELPDFINYCNERNVPVYFHTVSFPINCSIGEMPAQEIRNVDEFLSRFDFPVGNPVLVKNRQHYFDFKNQVKTWYQLSLAMPKTIDGIKDAIAGAINKNDKIPSEQKKIKLDKLFKKIDMITAKIDEDIVRKQMEGMMEKESAIETMIYYLERVPTSTLVILAKAISR